jgi:hypothetical protein
VDAQDHARSVAALQPSHQSLEAEDRAVLEAVLARERAVRRGVPVVRSLVTTSSSPSGAIHTGTPTSSPLRLVVPRRTNGAAEAAAHGCEVIPRR